MQEAPLPKVTPPQPSNEYSACSTTLYSGEYLLRGLGGAVLGSIRGEKKSKDLQLGTVSVKALCLSPGRSIEENPKW